MAWLRNRYFVVVLVWLATFLTLVGCAVVLDAHEFLDSVIRAHEDYQLDEIFVTLNIAGAFGLVYSLLRVRDLSEEVRLRNRAEAKIEWATHHDCLTGLPNRQMLNAYFAGPSKVTGDTRTIYSIDLAGLEKVNNDLGQSFGDTVIQATAMRLSELKPSDAVFHMGGDRFAIVSESNADPEAHAAKIIDTISQPIVSLGASIEIAANVGFAMKSDRTETGSVILRAAECAMYVAKEGGVNIAAAFVPEMAVAKRKRERMEADLKAAISANAILPYYQPLIDLQSGKTVGYEALARWKVANGNFIPPSEFIPFAEELGLIWTLTQNLLRRACQDASLWPSDTVLAFNLSAALLNDRQLGLLILKILGETGLPVHRLELEVTESAIIGDCESAHFVLDSLSDSGIRIALDDFGTGYSSLSQLAHYPFDKIKIDRSFISGSEDSEKQTHILKAIISLGSNLGMTIVAEGIERESEMRRLRDLGCHIGQGFFLGKPTAHITGPPGGEFVTS